MRDLKREREIVYLKLRERNIEPIWAENFDDNLRASETIIEEKLLEADGYIGIFDRYYGQVPKENNPESISVSNIEYNIAKKCYLPRLIFASRIKSGEKRDPNDEDDKFRKFLDQAGNYNKGNWINFYTDFEDFKKILQEKIPKFVNDLDHGGLPYELRKGIVKTPKDLSLSIANNNFDWYLHQTGHDYAIIIPKIFDKLQSFVLDVLVKNKSIIIKGRHGIGKSIFTRLTILQHLEDIPTILDSNKIQIERLTDEQYEVLSVRKPYFLIDPVDPLTYKEREQFPGNLFINLKDSLGQNINELIQNKVNFVGVIPTDKWNELEMEINGVSVKEIKLIDHLYESVENCDIVVCDFNEVLRERTFIEKVIVSYSKEEKDHPSLSSLVDKILEFNDGQPLLASYVGRLIDKGFETKSIEGILDQASLKVTNFFISYIWLIILKKEPNFIYGKMFGIIARLLLGKMPVRLIQELPLSLKSANLQPNDYAFCRWLSELDDDIILRSLRSIIIKSQDDSVTHEYTVMIDACRFIINQLKGMEELNNYYLIEDKIIVLLQTYLKTKIDGLNNIAKTSLAKLYANYLLNRNYNVKETDLIFSYFCNDKQIMESSFKILYGKPGYIPDILSFSITLNDPNIVKQYLSIRNRKVGDFYEVLTQIVYASISDNVDTEIISKSLKGILILLATYTKFFISHYVIIGNRFLLKISATSDEETIIMLSYLNWISNLDFDALSLILNKINFNNTINQVFLLAEPISCILLYRFLLYYYHRSNNDIEYDLLLPRVENYIKIHPVSGEILEVYTLDIKIDHIIKKGLKVDEMFIKKSEQKISNLKEKKDDLILNKFISSISLLEDDSARVNKWFFEQEIALKHLDLRYLMAQNELEKYKDTILHYEKEGILNDRFRVSLMKDLVSILRDETASLSILNKEISLRKLLNYNKDFIKCTIAINIFIKDLEDGTEIFKRFYQLFDVVDFTTLFLFGHFALCGKEIANMNSKEWFNEHFSYFSKKEQNSNSIIELNEVFDKYSNISRYILRSLEGIVLLIMFLYLHNEYRLIQKLLNSFMKKIKLPILYHILNEFKNGSIKDIDRFSVFIKKIYVAIVIPKIMF